MRSRATKAVLAGKIFVLGDMEKWTLTGVIKSKLEKNVCMHVEEEIRYLYISHKICVNPAGRNSLFKLSDLNDKDNILESNMRAERDNINPHESSVVQIWVHLLKQRMKS